MWYVTYDVHLPASEFRGQLGEEVGGCPGAGVWQRAGVMVGQGRWSGWGRVHRGPAVPQLSPVKGAADCGAAGQAASVWRGRGGGSSGPSNAECGGRRCRHAVTQGAAGKEGKWLCFKLAQPSGLSFSKCLIMIWGILSLRFSQWVPLSHPACCYWLRATHLLPKGCCPEKSQTLSLCRYRQHHTLLLGHKWWLTGILLIYCL